MIKNILALVALLCIVSVSFSQENKARPFVAYELGEMAFNRFQYFAGEAGLSFENGRSVRLVHMNVKLTEEHLSSNSAQAVDGPNVEGYFFGFELFYDFAIKRKFQIAPSLGYYKNAYSHTKLSASVTNRSPTVGLGFSYRAEDFLGVKGLYSRFSIPFRIYLDPMKETQFGESKVKDHSFDNNIWFFIGYQF